MYALKHKGKILGTFKSYALLLDYVLDNRLGIYQVLKDNEKFAIIVNGNQLTTYLYDKETCKEIFRNYFRWFVIASYIKLLKRKGFTNDYIYKRKVKPPFNNSMPIIIKTKQNEK